MRHGVTPASARERRQVLPGPGPATTEMRAGRQVLRALPDRDVWIRESRTMRRRPGPPKGEGGGYGSSAVSIPGAEGTSPDAGHFRNPRSASETARHRRRRSLPLSIAQRLSPRCLIAITAGTWTDIYFCGTARNDIVPVKEAESPAVGNTRDWAHSHSHCG